MYFSSAVEESRLTRNYSAVWKRGVNGCLGPECDVIGEEVGMRIETGSECGQW